MPTSFSMLPSGTEEKERAESVFSGGREVNELASALELSWFPCVRETLLAKAGE